MHRIKALHWEQEVSGSNPTVRSTNLRDKTSLQGSWQLSGWFCDNKNMCSSFDKRGYLVVSAHKRPWGGQMNTCLLIWIELMFHILWRLEFSPFLMPLTKHLGLSQGLLTISRILNHSQHTIVTVVTFSFTSHFMLCAFLYPTVSVTNMTKPA